MFNTISFEYPFVFFLLLLFFLCEIFCKPKSASIIMPHLNLYKQAASKMNYLLNTLRYLIIILSITALASPYKKQEPLLLKKDGINIVLNLDASGSMREEDFQIGVNRFDVLKQIVSDFIDKRINDNISLVVFGERVFTASPLSFDKEVQKEILSYLEVNMAGSKTAMFDSLATSINMLKDKDEKSNIIILLSDGEDNSSTIPYNVVLRLLEKYDIKVYTIGLGKANKRILQDIAEVSNARSYYATSKDDLKSIYKQINTIEKSKIEQKNLILKEILFFYPLFLAMILLTIYIYIRNKE